MRSQQLILPSLVLFLYFCSWVLGCHGIALILLCNYSENYHQRGTQHRQKLPTGTATRKTIHWSIHPFSRNTGLFFTLNFKNFQNLSFYLSGFFKNIIVWICWFLTLKLTDFKKLVTLSFICFYDIFAKIFNFQTFIFFATGFFFLQAASINWKYRSMFFLALYLVCHIY